MLTDDLRTPGDGHWEINLAWTFEHSGHSTASEAPLVVANFGVGDRIQLKYEVPWVVVAHDPDSSARSGIGASLVGIKWRFFDSGPDGWQVSTYPQISFRTGGSSAADGDLDDSGTLLLLPLEVQRTFGWLAVNLELGRIRDASGGDDTFAGVVAGHEAAERLEFMG